VPVAAPALAKCPSPARVVFCVAPYPRPVPRTALDFAVDVDVLVAAPVATLIVLHADGPLNIRSVFASSYVVPLVCFSLYTYYYC
jgi:hypothetical protein